MAAKMDKLEKKLKANPKKGRYGRCVICGKEHQGHLAVRAHAVAYKTTEDRKQEYLWSKSRAVCRDHAADFIDYIEAFFNGRN